MTLEEHIDDIRKGLEEGQYIIEADVSLGIIVRLLHALEWPTFDVKVVSPEYGVDRGNVDYALCHPASTPRVFIEVKRVGNIDKGIRQLFEYAFHKGVTILILTDGRKWRFYHPAGEGPPEDRQVAELDFIGGDSEECAKCLDRYLNYESVKIGNAAKVIAEDYQNIVNQRQIEERLPEVWSELVHEKNEYLLLAMMEKAKDKVGSEPTEEQVLTFLKNLSVRPVGPAKEQPKRLRVTIPGEEAIERKYGIDTFVDVIEKIGIERVKELGIKRSTIPLISTSKDPKRSQRQHGQYYIVSELSQPGKKTTLEEIARKLKIDLKVELVDKI